MARSKVRILGTGLDAQSAAPMANMTVEDLEQRLQGAFAAVRANPNIELEICWLSLADEKVKPTSALEQYLADAKEPFDGILVGWGLRAAPPLTWLFEDTVDAVRRAAPTSKLIFNNTAQDMLAAVYRSFPQAELKE